MRRALLITAVLTACTFATAWASPAADPAEEILALERRVMDGWSKGDPDPLLELAAPDVTYVHTEVGKRLVGLPALKALCDRYRGAPLFESYEIVSPKVHLAGSTAVLTYRLVQHTRAGTALWDGTVVYQKKQPGWRMVHSHWSGAKDQ